MQWGPASYFSPTAKAVHGPFLVYKIFSARSEGHTCVGCLVPLSISLWWWLIYRYDIFHATSEQSTLITHASNAVSWPQGRVTFSGHSLHWLARSSDLWGPLIDQCCDGSKHLSCSAKHVRSIGDQTLPLFFPTHFDPSFTYVSSMNCSSSCSLLKDWF